ncbi:MAG: Polyphosphate kinase [Chloroflexi bacterium ADurb.Bin325]|nr:MAG: Polyphosphate kinase [Chloroflexi bacterium ADurb.Bin325]
MDAPITLPKTLLTRVPTWPPEAGVDLKNPALYFNRELSWLEFNRRVLEEAEDTRHPLLERAKFLAIFSSNLDEFFMIRVSGLEDQVDAGVTATPADGLTPAEQLAAIRTRVPPMMHEQRRCFYDDIIPQLAAADIHLLRYSQLTLEEQDRMREYFRSEVLPVLTPLAFDPGRPFPHISNLSLNLACWVKGPSGQHFARVKVPTSLPRLVPVVEGSRFVWLEDVIAANLGILFPGHEIEQAYSFRVIRDADIEIQEDEASDLLETIEQGLRQRRFGPVVCLVVDEAMPADMVALLAENMEVDPGDIYPLQPPLDMSSLWALMALNQPELKDPPFVPSVPPQLRDIKTSDELFAAIRKGDILLHHPYDSFNPVLDFVQAAATDPDVLAIKQTLYRVGRNAPVVRSLLEAQRNGKQVAVLVELKARFDEESNIGWARALEAQGVHVVYGLVGLKTHSKVTLVVRREAGGLRRYLHLATGNYNAVTAGIYTDLGLLTCDPEMGADVTEMFNTLTGYSTQQYYRSLLVAPGSMREQLMTLIERETEHALEGRPARLIFKMNSLVDERLIRAIYRASQAGVDVDLIVRGICCLRPGVPCVSDNIRVISIVGRFLEHSRIYYFENGGAPEVYLGSADLMPRNLDRRVEVIFPVRDPAIRGYIRHTLLEVELHNNTRARVLQPDGRYLRRKPRDGEPIVDSQAWQLAHPCLGGHGAPFVPPDDAS